MSSGRRRKRSQPACPRPLAHPPQPPYLALWRVRTPLAPGDPASATKSYQKPRACSALATPSIRTDELFRLATDLSGRSLNDPKQTYSFGKFNSPAVLREISSC